MANIQNINVSQPNDGLGDSLRQSQVKANANFSELNSKKVEAEAGKGLSANDFTTTLKQKVDGIESGAKANVQSDWLQSNPNSDDFIKNKPIEQFVTATGYVDYANSSIAQNAVAGIELKLTNDKLGVGTVLDKMPFGVSNLFNSTTNQFDFSQLNVGDWVNFRPDLLIDLVGTNTSFSLYMKMAIGSGKERTLPIHNGERKSTDAFIEVPFTGFYIGSEEVRDFPAELYILTDANATVKVNGFLLKIERTNLNIVNIQASVDNNRITFIPATPYSFNNTTKVLTMTAGWEATINDLNLITQTQTLTPIQPATDEFKRIDLIFLNTSGVFNILQGLESESVPIKPVLPVNTVEAFFITVFGEEINLEPQTVPLASTTTSGTVKTDITQADPVVYTKTTVDVLLENKADAEAFSNHINANNPHPTLFNAKEDKNQKGAVNGYAPLDSLTKIASQYLNIVNDLVTGGTTDLASAETVKTLKTQIDAINLLLTSDNINLDSVQELVDAIETIQSSLSTILVNDLTTGGITKALTAEMGKQLNLLVQQKQNTLVSGTNIKTINGQSLLSGGNITTPVGALSSLTEGNGFGYRITGRNPAHYGNIGADATDLSFQDAAYTDRGATGQRSFAIGNYTHAAGVESVAMGGYNVVTGNTSLVGGAYSTVSGNVAFGYGYLIKSRANYEFSIGINGTDYVPNGSNNRLFNIGNGGVGVNDSNDAFTVLRNGNIGVNNALPTEKFDIDGKLRVRDLPDANNIVAYDRQLVAKASGEFGWVSKIEPPKKIEDFTNAIITIPPEEGVSVASLQIPNGFLLENELYEYVFTIKKLAGTDPYVYIYTGVDILTEFLLDKEINFWSVKSLGNLLLEFNLNSAPYLLEDITVYVAADNAGAQVQMKYNGIRKIN